MVITFDIWMERHSPVLLLSVTNQGLLCVHCATIYDIRPDALLRIEPTQIGLSQPDFSFKVNYKVEVCHRHFFPSLVGFRVCGRWGQVCLECFVLTSSHHQQRVISILN